MRPSGRWVGEHVEYIFLYWLYSAKNWGIYDSWRVSVRASGRWVGAHVSVEDIYIYLYWIYSANNWGNICQLNLYIGIGYILPTIGGYMPFGGCQCSHREQGWGICNF